MDHLKNWLERSDNPASYYELLDCPCFCQDQQRLLAAVRVATRFLHPYENHKTGEIVRRARSLQLLCATAGHTFADEAKWRFYDHQLKVRLREDYFSQAPEVDVRKWLLDKRAVTPDRLDEIAMFIIASARPPAREDTPPASGSPIIPNDVAGDGDKPSSTPSRIGPPPLPAAASRPSHRPPPLPPRHQPTKAAGFANTDPSETAIALEAVTMTIPAQQVAPIPTTPSAARPAVVASPPKMSGPRSAMAIRQKELEHSAPAASKLGNREKLALWLSGIFVAIAIVGIIMLLSLGQSSRKSAPYRQATRHEQVEHGYPPAMNPSKEENQKVG